jgi:hypothetical protein
VCKANTQASGGSRVTHEPLEDDLLDSPPFRFETGCEIGANGIILSTY